MRGSEIELKGIYKIFGPDPASAIPLLRQGMTKAEVLESTGRTVGLNDVSLQIPAGRTSVVMGLSGSGKSTLIRHLNRLVEPTAGAVLVDGRNILQFSEAALGEFRRRRVAMVFQGFGLFPHRTVLANVAYGLRIQGKGRREGRRLACEWIERVGLAGYEAAYPNQLSGGMQQRVGLARALATDPEILLLDEPFSALDPLIRRDMQDQLLALQASLQKTIVFITHDLDEALRLGDQVAILKDGAVIQVGAPQEIVLKPADAYVESFVRDVDRRRILTAAAIMTPPDMLAGSAEAPRAVLARFAAAECDYACVSDGGGRLLGVLTVREAERSAAEGDATVESRIATVPTVGPAVLLADFLPLTLANEWPLPVVSDRGQLLGVISHRTLIRALAGR